LSETQHQIELLSNNSHSKYTSIEINEDEKIYVEMKNKHNTMNSSSSQKTYILSFSKYGGFDSFNV
jgi:hypothetical protein